MITMVNKGKTLIYIYYNREAKPEIFLMSQARAGFAKLMLLRDELGGGSGGGDGGAVVSLSSPL